ncbi:MAG: ribbon-helix-helix domain-containing protein [Candidatus Bathyarchaeia archaeon]
MINASSLLKKRMRLVTVKIPEALLEDMDELVRVGLYPNRSSVIRAAVRDLVRRELWDRGGGSYRRALNSNRTP